MKEDIETNFPSVKPNGCLSTHKEEKFGIFDCSSSGKCQIQTHLNGLIQFTVFNPKKKHIHFLRIDGCLLPSSKGPKRCDFAVFDNKSFCFVELKESKANSNKARTQLLETIELLQRFNFGL